VDVGWVDLYAAGLTCNWVDITEVDTSAGAVTQPLFFESNPDGFMCEGDLVLDANGEPEFEDTEFTYMGEPVRRPACEEAAGTEGNDRGEIDVTVPVTGGMVSSPCREENQPFGPLRNCGFTQQPNLRNCTAGQMVTINCTGGNAAQPQVVRICEGSRDLGAGVDCVFEDALANEVADSNNIALTFRCPSARDATETGGRYAVYTAPVFEPDGPRALTCN
jgi:hypothetical protein